MHDLLQQLPVMGETWKHTRSGRLYGIEGSVFNAITDAVDVVYVPLYPCEFARCSRQIIGHPKGFLSKNEEGSPRFVRVKTAVETQEG